MIDEVFAFFISATYSRSDFSYRVSLLRELLEFAFFTKQSQSVTSDTISAFATSSNTATQDIEFLRLMPLTALAAFTATTFYADLDELTKKGASAPTFSLSVPVSFSPKEITDIGLWARETLNSETLLELNVDPSLAAGCQFAWGNKLHDFSLDSYFGEHDTELKAAILQSVVPSNVT